MAEPIDFRKILIAYADNVGECELVSFLYPNHPLAALTAEENAALFDAVAEGRWQEEHKAELREAATAFRKSGGPQR